MALKCDGPDHLPLGRPDVTDALLDIRRGIRQTDNDEQVTEKAADSFAALIEYVTRLEGILDDHSMWKEF